MRKYILWLMVIAVVAMRAHEVALKLGVSEPEFPMIVAVVTSAIMVAIVVAIMVADNLDLKFGWVFAANLAAIAVIGVGLATNPGLACLFLLGLILRQIGDLPKAELETA